jgi:hypothetical protein
MRSEWLADYKGYGIVASASGCHLNCFTASYTITKPAPGGPQIVWTDHCEGTYDSGDAAWAAASFAAQRKIETLPSLR